MPSVNSILYRANYGIPGDLSRGSGKADLEAATQSISTPVTAFGVPVKLSSNGLAVQPIGTSADVVYGFSVRVFPTENPNAGSEPLGTATPRSSGPIDIMRRGWMSVVVNAGTPQKGGKVYVRYANAATGKPVGGVEAAYIAGTTAQIPYCEFMGGADANGNAEIFFDNNAALTAIVA